MKLASGLSIGVPLKFSHRHRDFLFTKEQFALALQNHSLRLFRDQTTRVNHARDMRLGKQNKRQKPRQSDIYIM